MDDLDPRKRTTWSRWKAHLNENVTESWADAILVILSFVTGLVDSAIFNVWSCFVSMQTGNTVYVGLGVSGQPLSQPYRWIKSSTAILSFCLGSYLFSRFHRWLGPLRRLTLVLSFAFQALLCLASGAMVVSDLVPSNAGTLVPEGNFIVLLPLALLSIQSAGQIVLSRVLAYGEVPTVVLTSTYTDLFMDEGLFTDSLTKNSKRNRRVLAIVLLLLGAIVGGFLTKDEGSISNPLWIAGVAKVIVALMWMRWKAKGAIALE